MKTYILCIILISVILISVMLIVFTLYRLFCVKENFVNENTNKLGENIEADFPVPEISPKVTQQILNSPLHGGGISIPETYYKDPKDMTPEQIEQFKYRSNVNKMTMKDYTNWLHLFEKDQTTLSLEHYNNLLKLINGIPITDIPKHNPYVPYSISKYFEGLYKTSEVGTPKTSTTTGKVVEANYDDFYMFEPPQNLKHMDRTKYYGFDGWNEKLKSEKGKIELDCVRPQITSNIKSANTGDTDTPLAGTVTTPEQCSALFGE